MPLSGESEPAIEDSADVPARRPADSESAGDQSTHPRPFRSWASAYEADTGPSVWARMRGRISGMFSRKRDDSQPSRDVSAADAPTSFDTSRHQTYDAAETPEAETDPLETEPLEIEPLETESHDADPFEAGPTEALVVEPEMVEEVTVQWIESAEPPASTPDGYAEPGDAMSADAGSADESFASVDDALPADPETHEQPPAPAAPKRGFFARLFGGRAVTAEPAPEEPIADTNEHQLEAADAAANALDVAAEEAFPPVEDTPTFAPDGFAPEDPDVLTASDAGAGVEVTLPLAEEPSGFAVESAFGSDAFAADPVASDAFTADPLEIPVEQNAESTAAGEPMALADQALPMVEGTFESVDEPAPKEKRPSFIGRLFGRKTKPAPRPSLEIEIHEDRIEAAAQALDSAADDAFAPPSGTLPEASGDPSAMVESPDAMEVVEDSRATMEVAQDSRATMEVAQDSRATMEVAPPSPSAVPDFGDTVDLDAPAVPDFGATLEIEEKTDEFAVVTAPPVDIEGPTGDIEEDTLDVPKRSLIAKLLGLNKKKTQVATSGATVVEGNPVFLFSKFRAFYNEIIRFKHQKSEFTAGFSTAIVTEYAADLSPDASAEAQSKKLYEMLELQAAEAKWMGGEAGERYPDAQYAMAALADEIFTHIEWEGQGAWSKHLLEVKLYKTHAADVELFRRIDKLLKDKPNSPVARDLARVYLLVIAAGFTGKYRPFGLTRALADYRQRLYEFVHAGDPLMLYAPDRKIFPDAASRTLEGHAVSRFSAAQRWAAILLFIVTAYTVIAHVAWNRVSADLKDVTSRIMSGNTTAGVR